MPCILIWHSQWPSKIFIIFIKSSSQNEVLKPRMKHSKNLIKTSPKSMQKCWVNKPFESSHKTLSYPIKLSLSINNVHPMKSAHTCTNYMPKPKIIIKENK